MNAYFNTLCKKILSFRKYHGESEPYLATETLYSEIQALSLGRTGCLNDLSSEIVFY